MICHVGGWVFDKPMALRASQWDYELLSFFLGAMCGKQNSKIRYPNLWLKGGEIRAERGKGTTEEVLLYFELPFQRNGNSRLVGYLSIFQQKISVSKESNFHCG